MIMSIWVCMMFVENCWSRTQNRQRFTAVPENKTVLLGSRLRLPCRVKDRRGIVQWTKNDFGLGVKKDLPNYNRYRMIGNDEEDFSLEINPVTKEDEAKFQCQVGFGPKGQAAIRSQYSWVTVVIPPKPPKILQGNLIIAPEGMEIPLECISGGGKPPPQLEWVDPKGKLVFSTTEKMIDTTEKNTFTVTSAFRMKLERRHHNTTITCRAKYGGVQTYRSTNVLFQVLYPPEVRVKRTPSEWISEGSDVIFRCRAEGNPPEFKFEWIVDEKVIVGMTKSELVIENVPKELDNVMVKCSVENAVGKSTVSELLRVSYGPRFRSPPKSVAVEVGAVITLFCDAVGNPSPSVTWLRNNAVIGTSSNLTLVIREHSGGIYACKAIVPGFPEIQAEYGVLIKGKPIIVISGSLRKSIGGGVKLKCFAFSSPPPPRIIWTFQGTTIEKDDQQDYFIREKILSNGLESTLTFSRSDASIYGAYKCSVTNAYGTDSAEQVLEIYDNFLIKIAGTVGGVVFVAAVVMSLCAFFCRKNYHKPKFSKSVVNSPKADSKCSPLPHSKNTNLPASKENLQANNMSTFLKDSWDGKTHSRTDNALTVAKDSECLVTNGLYDYSWSFQPDNYSNNGGANFSSFDRPSFHSHQSGFPKFTDFKDLQLRNSFGHLPTSMPSSNVSFFEKGFPKLGRLPSGPPKYENTTFGTFYTEV